MSGTSGPTSYAPFATWDHDSQSWKTSEATSLWALTLSSLTLPASGGLRNGSLFERPTPALHTNGPDSSSLPTPVADHSRGLPQPGSDYASLPNAVIGLPTPRATDGTNGGPNQRGSSGDMMLPSAVMHLPTPTTRDFKGANQRGDETCLHGALLPTPATTNGKSTRAMTASSDNGRRSGGGQSSPPGLEEMAQIMSGTWPEHMPPPDRLPPATRTLLPTPTSQAAKHGELSPVEREGNRPQDRGNLWVVMPRMVETALLPTPSVADGTGGHLHRSGDRSGELLLPGVARQIGAATAQPSPDGNPSSDDQPHDLLSLVEQDSRDFLHAS
jgi:hypothetical protein